MTRVPNATIDDPFQEKPLLKKTYLSGSISPFLEWASTGYIHTKAELERLSPSSN